MHESKWALRWDVRKRGKELIESLVSMVFGSCSAFDSQQLFQWSRAPCVKLHLSCAFGIRDVIERHLWLARCQIYSDRPCCWLACQRRCLRPGTPGSAHSRARYRFEAPGLTHRSQPQREICSKQIGRHLRCHQTTWRPFFHDLRNMARESEWSIGAFHLPWRLPGSGFAAFDEWMPFRWTARGWPRPNLPG